MKRSCKRAGSLGVENTPQRIVIWVTSGAVLSLTGAAIGIAAMVLLAVVMTCGVVVRLS
jgi:hypothetical protein